MKKEIKTRADVYAMPAGGINLFTFLDTINCNLELRRYANQNGRWLAQIERAELKEGHILSGSYGTGKNPEQAIEDYVQRIKGKLLVINAASDERKEFKVPKTLYFIYYKQEKEVNLYYEETKNENSIRQ
jgi:hypothetical protein